MKLNIIEKYANKEIAKTGMYEYSGKFYFIELELNKNTNTLCGTAFIDAPEQEPFVLCEIERTWDNAAAGAILSSLFDEIEKYGENMILMYQDIVKVNKL